MKERTRKYNIFTQWSPPSSTRAGPWDTPQHCRPDMLRFVAELCTADPAGFTNRRPVATLHGASLSGPVFQQHLLASVSVSYFGNFLPFSLLYLLW